MLGHLMPAPFAFVRTALAMAAVMAALLGLAAVTGHGSALAQDADGDTAAEAESLSADEMHAAVLIEDRFPSASVCGQCHPKQYREWSVSPHAYGQLSPVVMAFQTVTTKKVTSTVGDFCQRCHAPISAALGLPAEMSNLDRPLVARESITCIACHRVNQDFGRITGRFPILEGDIHEPVYSVSDGGRFMEILNQPERYQLQPNRGEQGRTVHAAVKPFFELRSPNFCGAVCHEVTAQTGARSHEMLTEYKRSPAAAKGITCVDCHMGSVQGKPSPFEMGPAAVVGGVPTQERPLSNHFMAGPDYSIVHPGIFPHNVEAAQFKTPHEWIAFDVEAGWGSDDFEDEVDDDYPFPEAWESVDDRYDARAILDEAVRLAGLGRGAAAGGPAQRLRAVGGQRHQRLGRRHRVFADGREPDRRPLCADELRYQAHGVPADHGH